MDDVQGGVRKGSMLKLLGQCIGLASLILVMNYGDLLGGGHEVRMHVPFALTRVVYAQLMDMLLLGLLLFAVIGPLSRTRLYPWVRLALAIVVPPYLVERTRTLYPFHLSISGWVVLAAVWAAIVLLLLLRFHGGYQRLMRVGDFAGIFLAVFAFCSMVQLLCVTWWRPGPHEHTVAWATTTQPPRVHPRLVWIVFDELSYDQVYGHRASGLALPHFDALRSESTVFSDAQPIGERTVKVLPSLLSGRTVDDYRFTFDNRLKVQDLGQRGFHRLDGAGTVFADAQREGWRTAAVGWYNPYCTIYADALDDCFWMNLDLMDGGMVPGASFWQNVYRPLRELGEQIVTPERQQRELCSDEVRQRTRTYVDLNQHAERVLQTDQADFVFLHLPVPHSPNIWSRAHDDYAQGCGSSYVDSLALADRELGSILARLKSSPRWKDTTVIVEGDHSWRTYLWKDGPEWTHEDAQASRAGFDPQPAVIVHLAGQTQPELNATPWSLLNVHTVVEQAIHGEAVHF
jgi:hypothetical protein